MGEAEDAYNIVCEEFDEPSRGHTQLWKYVKELASFGIINATLSAADHRGKTTLIGLPRIAAGDLEKELTKHLRLIKR
jgi:cell division control protein 6